MYDDSVIKSIPSSQWEARIMKSCIINYDESHYKSGQFFSELFPAKNANAKITMDTIVNNK